MQNGHNKGIATDRLLLRLLLHRTAYTLSLFVIFIHSFISVPLQAKLTFFFYQYYSFQHCSVQLKAKPTHRIYKRTYTVYNSNMY